MFPDGKFGGHVLIILIGVLGAGASLAICYLWLVLGRPREASRGPSDTAAVMPYLQLPPARVRYLPRPIPASANYEHDPVFFAGLVELNRLWRQLDAAGLRQLATLASADGTRTVIVGAHPESHIIAQVLFVHGYYPHVEFCALTVSNTVMVLTGDPGATPLVSPPLRVVASPAPDYEAALEAFSGAPAARALDPQRATMLLECIYATRMDARLDRPATLDEMYADAALRGVKERLDERHHRLLHAMHRKAWLGRLRDALLDRARRLTGYDDVAWSELEARLIVIHERMDNDAVLRALSVLPIPAWTVDRFRLQGLEAAALFDQLSACLEPQARPRLLATIDLPLKARVFVPPGSACPPSMVPMEAGLVCPGI